MEKERLQMIITELLMAVPEFAKSVNVSRDTIYNILHGKTKMTSFVKGKLFEAYPNINRVWFEEGTGDMFTWKEPVTPKLKKFKEGGADQDKDFIIDQYQQLITSQQKLIDKLSEDSIEYQKRITLLVHENERLKNLNK